MLLPTGQDASPSQGYPPEVCCWYPFIHLTWVKRDKVELSFLSQETMQQARLQPHSTTPPPPVDNEAKYNYQYLF